MTIEKAKITDNETLTAITKKSKAFWGYSPEQIQEWDKNLTISQDYIKEHNVYKLTVNNLIIGYYSYFFKDEKERKKIAEAGLKRCQTSDYSNEGMIKNVLNSIFQTIK